MKIICDESWQSEQWNSEHMGGGGGGEFGNFEGKEGKNARPHASMPIFSGIT